MPVALVGRLPVKVTNENGPINVGDFITTSSTPGHGMKATEAGRVVGMAIGNFYGVEGLVMVQVSNTWWQPPAIMESATIIEAPVGTFFDLEATNGEFTDLFAASAVFNVLQGASGSFDELFVDSGTFQDLEAVTGVFSMLEVTSGSFEELQAANAVFTNVESESGTFTNLEAKTGTFTNLVAKSGVTIGEGGDVATITRYLSAMSELDFSLAANSCEDLEVAVDGAGIA